MNYEDAIEAIHSFNVFGSRLGLERMKKLLELLGNPHENLKILHVAGTNGKGSVCRYLYSVLQENGYRTGAYFSPYLERFTERIEFDGAEISREALARHTERTLAEVKRMIGEGFESPTEFEVVTAIGLSYFAEQHADYVILEVGLGGKGDSTNICEKPEVTAITSISYDHMAQLGDTLELIAADKAGIIKNGVPVVVNVEDAGAFEVIRQRAEDLDAPLVDVRNCRVDHLEEHLEGYAFDAVLTDGTRFDDIRLCMHGRHQVANALCALQMIAILQRGGVSMTEAKIREGMRRAKQKGRFEILQSDPYLILDGAHNPAGTKALTETVLTHFKGKRILLCTGILKDKSYHEMARELARLEADLIVTEVPNPRKMPAEELAESFGDLEIYKTGKRTVTAISDYRQALKEAGRRGSGYDLVLWAGSLYLIGEIRRLVTCSQ